MPTETNPYFCHLPETVYATGFAPEQPQSRSDWKLISTPSPSLSTHNWMGLEGFNQDWEMFGNIDYDFPPYPNPLPDSPLCQHNPRQLGYVGPSMSKLVAGAGMEGMGDLNEG